MTRPQPDHVYLIELCSGERCRWRYLGPDSRGALWWRDVDSGREFNEASLMYAWAILSEEPLLPAGG